MIRRKQVSSQKEWVNFFNNAEYYISKGEIDALTYNTVEELVKTTAGKRVAYGWSGGKDSIVVQKLCELAGIEKAVIFTHDLEYKDFADFIRRNAPAGLEVVKTKHDLEWLKKNEENFLFPIESKYSDAYMIQIQRNGLKRYFKRNNLEQVIMGVRIHDGNNVPKKIMVNKDGYTRNAIIKDWTNEQVMAFIKYNNLELPRTYLYEDGFIHGTGPWSALKRVKGRGLKECWEYVHQYDKEAVERAGEYFELAKEVAGRGK